ncbi:hypothetical protein TCAL_06196 [Tigriopus californicus]|uniref:Chitin-binding type-2 domain-containing protein n=2 Tax=Tigriopus californicus TaxID=6832 RepID=A0A553NTL2_TIGCA|nr:hypothetical protein TCAL_06196 [Tigriopus californicus]
MPKGNSGISSVLIFFWSVIGPYWIRVGLKNLKRIRGHKMGLSLRAIMMLSLTVLQNVIGRPSWEWNDEGSLSPSTSHHRVKRWEEFPNATFTFDCTDRSIGFYADLEFDCQIFHLCDAAGRRVPYMCDKMTAFNQKYRVCDWAYNVDCETSPDWYYLNDLTYEAPPPKVEY